MNDKNTQYSKYRNETIAAKAETDKKYMILKPGGHLLATAGLGWYILHTFFAIEEAVEYGYIPVIDWENCFFPEYDYSSRRINVWELFFEQPCGVGCQEAYTSGDYYLVDDVLQVRANREIKFPDFQNFKAVHELRTRFQTYVRLSQTVKEEAHKFWEQLAGHKTLGVLIRGTDYKELKPMQHPKNVTLKEMKDQINNLLEQGGYERIFVATEDSRILSELKSRYKEKLVCLPAPRYQDTGNRSLNMENSGWHNGEHRNHSYLLSLALLAKCSALVLSPCGGSIVAALLHREPIEAYKFIFHGYYAHKAYVLGSRLEREKGELLWLNGRPLIYYALNTLFLMHIFDITIITSKNMRGNLLQFTRIFSEKGIHIRYLLDEREEGICKKLAEDYEHFKDEGVCLIREDDIFYGCGLGREMSEKASSFDGAYLWGTVCGERIVQESVVLGAGGMPLMVTEFSENSKEKRQVAGCCLFDRDFSRVLVEKLKGGKKVELKDIMQEYCEKKKLIYTDFRRGTIWVSLDSEETLYTLSELFTLLEKNMGETIGDAVSTADLAGRYMPVNRPHNHPTGGMA